MAAVRERWLSPQAAVLHVVAIVAATGCALATWWQITRAQDGNPLSYFYSAMWPAFGLLVVYFWWALLHTDFESAGRKGVQRQQAETTQPDVVPPAVLAGEQVDPELAAYNARLAELATQGPKTWRRHESVITRRPQ